MSFCLLPNKVYATNPTHMGTVIAQAVHGNVLLYGTNVKKYKKTSDGKVRVIIPNFSEMAVIRDDLLLENTFQPLTCLTSFIGFITKEEGTELWLNLGIDIKLTPAICYINE
nr:MAG TPA: PTH2-tRNA hydrolase, type 2 (PTH2) [Caudoviricetes sp.]